MIRKKEQIIIMFNFIVLLVGLLGRTACPDRRW
jgi:hypothetical protein